MLFSNNERKMQNITQLAENFQISQEIPSKIQNPDILRKKEFGGNFFAFLASTAKSICSVYWPKLSSFVLQAGFQDTIGCEKIFKTLTGLVYRPWGETLNHRS